jgi:muramoyltetrapeptide carboxypeptidase
MPTPKSPSSLLKPPPLLAGDTVGIIAPASNIQRDLLERGCAALRKLGYKPFFFDSIFDRDLYFAGPVERRVREFHEMFERDDVRAIVCARGGYGCNYLLEHLDLDLIRRHPKILVGYSDLTAFLTCLHDATGLITFHGPMVTKDFASDGGVHTASWLSAVHGTALAELTDDVGLVGLESGVAEGPLYGGCLSILTASLGTPYEIQTAGTILFLEDMNEKPYQIDRMLMQLALAGKLDAVRGFVFGEMLDCNQPGGQDYTLQEVIMRVLQERCPGVPVGFGLRSGHVSQKNVTLPIGVRAALQVDGARARLTILESAVVERSSDDDEGPEKTTASSPRKKVKAAKRTSRTSR